MRMALHRHHPESIPTHPNDVVERAVVEILQDQIRKLDDAADDIDRHPWVSTPNVQLEGLWRQAYGSALRVDR
jgi:hypothetical protein